MPRFPLDEWQAQTLRVTVFPAPSSILPPNDWWRSVVGADPDEERSNPKKGTKQFQGRVGNGQLTLRLEADRIDWVLTAADSEDAGVDAFHLPPSLGPAVAQVDEFSKLIQRWLGSEGLPSVSRLAFGAILQHVVPSRREGYIVLPEYIPVRLDPESSDFMFQINLPVSSRSGIQDLQLNRLSKWSVQLWQPFSFALGEGVPRQTALPAVAAMAVELDINTVPFSISEIPSGRLVPLLSELISEGMAIVESGIV